MRTERLEPRFIESAPEILEDGVLYISTIFATVLHRCACGCGYEVVTPLRPGKWRLIFDGAVSIRPSIGNRSFPCRSHYLITRDRVQWLPAFSEDSRGKHVRAGGRGQTWRRWRSSARTEAPAPKPWDVVRMRRASLQMTAAALAVTMLAILAEALPEPRYAAIGAVTAGAGTAVIIGGLIAFLFAGTYREDRRDVQRHLGAATGYVRRAATWGIAAAGLGALLTSALPARLTEAITDHSTLPTAGWIAVFLGGVGVGLGILEEWQGRASSRALAHRAPASTTPTVAPPPPLVFPGTKGPDKADVEA